LANLQVIEEERLVERAAQLGEIFQPEVRRIGKRFPRQVGAVHGRGLVAAMHMVKPGGIEPDSAVAAAIVRRSIEKGLMLFAPVGFGSASVKLAPPLVISEAALREGLQVLEEAMAEVLQ
jgi:4-aminobutyrate aminotransferase-like enzyme